MKRLEKSRNGFARLRRAKNLGAPLVRDNHKTDSPDVSRLATFSPPLPRRPHCKS